MHEGRIVTPASCGLYRRPSVDATSGFVAFLRKRTAKQVFHVAFSWPLTFQAPSPCWASRRYFAPSRYQSWSPIFSVPYRTPARSMP